MSESTATVHFRGLSGTIDLEVPSGSTLAEAAREAKLSEDLSYRSAGSRVDPSDEVQDGAQYTATPAEVKQGK